MRTMHIRGTEGNIPGINPTNTKLLLITKKLNLSVYYKTGILYITLQLLE